MKIVAQKDGRADRNGLYRIMIRCRFDDGSQRYVNTGVKVSEREWGKRKRIINNPVKEGIIDKAMIDLEKWRLSVLALGRRPTIDLFDDWINMGASGDTFNNFYSISLENDKTIVELSKRSQRRSLELINQFNPSINFNSIDRKMILAFHNFISGMGFAQNTIKGHHKNFKKFINRAIDEGKLIVTMDRHPYRSFSVPAKESDRQFLSDNEMNVLKDAELLGTLAKVRDLFLFSCDTGMRFADTQSGEIVWNEAGIEYKPGKTQRFTGLVRVPYEVMMFPDHVKNCEGNLLKISNQECNGYLKILMNDCEIKKYLTFHVSRHTFCTNVARKTGNLFKLMKYAGLRKSDTAMIYIHLAGV